MNRNHNTIIINKKGAILAYVLIIGAALIIISTIAFTMAKSSIGTADSGIKSREAYLSAKSGIEFAKSSIDFIETEAMNDLQAQIDEKYENPDHEVTLADETYYGYGNLTDGFTMNGSIDDYDDARIQIMYEVSHSVTSFTGVTEGATTYQDEITINATSTGKSPEASNFTDIFEKGISLTYDTTSVLTSDYIQLDEGYQDIEVIFKIISSWHNGFRYKITIKNKSANDVEGWVLYFDYPGVITVMDDGMLTSLGGNRYQISRYDRDYLIKANSSQSFSGSGTIAAGEVITNVLLTKTYKTINATMAYSITDSWNQNNKNKAGFNYSIRLRNLSDMPVTGWTLEFTYSGNITSCWDGRLTSLGNNRYRIKNPLTYNITIPVNGSLIVAGGGTGIITEAGNPTDVTLNGTQIPVE